MNCTTLDPTPREVQVIEMLSRGKCLKQVAYELGIAEKTAKSHVYNVHRKLNAGNQSHCYRLMIERGYIRVNSCPIPIDRLRRLVDVMSEAGRRTVDEWSREAA